MKRINYLIEPIADIDNLRLAFWKAAKGKRHAEAVMRYGEQLENNLNCLNEQILDAEVHVGKYRFFKIYEPKERQICASDFSEQVLHHAIMNVCHPYFERAHIFDSYASRKDKGKNLNCTNMVNHHKGSNRVIRGGNWGNNARNCRVSNRNNNEPDERNNNIGFRLVCSPSSKEGWIASVEQMIVLFPYGTKRRYFSSEAVALVGRVERYTASFPFRGTIKGVKQSYHVLWTLYFPFAPLIGSLQPQTRASFEDSR